jgi:site-specific DNA-methyltransferase (adenine-specific)
MKDWLNQCHFGDCLEVMRRLPDNCVDSIVTDPPYGISFMGKKWDYDVPAVEVWAEALRVLKPGGYLLVFAGTRTQHRMACRIEDAGFEIRDMIAWVYGSGFPKSHNGEWGGTALKPALEPITMARKPFSGTVAANWEEHGTGALNIDGCRIATENNLNGGAYSSERKPSDSEWVKHGGTIHSSTGQEFVQPEGRWPANLIHDGSDEVVAMFPQSAGQQGDVRGTEVSRTGGENTNCYGKFGRIPAAARNDIGSASRFFYCAKASKEDRNEGCSGLSAKTGGMVSNTSGQHITRRDGGAPGPRANHHPTVKPTDLMRYLLRLVTPPNGIALDMFMGSGSTCCAAVLEGFQFIGIDFEAEYVEIARARTDSARRQGFQSSLDLEAA